MCNNRECADYSKSQRTHHRCSEELGKKWKSYGKVAGRITLRQTSEEEQWTVGGIIGRVSYEGAIRFSFLEFEQGLQKARLAPMGTKAVLEEYFERPLITTRRRQRERQEKRKEFLGRSCEYFKENAGGEAAASVWLRKMISERKYGYQLSMRGYTRGEKQVELLMQNVENVVMKLKELTDKEGEYLLAVLATEIADNPHHFDRSTTAGLLLIHAICCCENMELPEDAHQWRKMLTQTSVVLDNISSMVRDYGLRPLTKQGWRGVYDAFCERKEPYVITMGNMKGIIGIQAIGGKAYIVENEMIFSYLVHNLKNSGYTLLCTPGQPRSVAQVLITYTLANGSKIHYNGNIDPNGTCAADKLWKKFGDRIHTWRMSPEDYDKSLLRERIGGIERAKLENIDHPILRKVAGCMREKQLAGHQENMLKELPEDTQN